MYIEPQLLDMARAQAIAKYKKYELPYKPPYKYLDSDDNERVADTKWFDTFTDNFFGTNGPKPEDLHELQKTD